MYKNVTQARPQNGKLKCTVRCNDVCNTVTYKQLQQMCRVVSGLVGHTRAWQPARRSCCWASWFVIFETPFLAGWPWKCMYTGPGQQLCLGATAAVLCPCTTKCKAADFRMTASRVEARLSTTPRGFQVIAFAKCSRMNKQRWSQKSLELFIRRSYVVLMRRQPPLIPAALE